MTIPALWAFAVMGILLFVWGFWLAFNGGRSAGAFASAAFCLVTVTIGVLEARKNRSLASKSRH
jgi:hypothetical protein